MPTNNSHRHTIKPGDKQMKSLTTKFSWGLCAAAMAFAISARSAIQDVAISGFSFQPSSVSISTGDSVRWTEDDGAFHSSTSDDSFWDSGSLPFHGQFTYQFTTPGDYPYHC